MGTHWYLEVRRDPKNPNMGVGTPPSSSKGAGAKISVKNSYSLSNLSVFEMFLAYDPLKT